MADHPFTLLFREGALGTDDLLAAMLPLLDQVGDAHEEGLVAPLDGLGGLGVDDGRVILVQGFQPPRKNASAVEALQKKWSKALQVVGERRHVAEADTGEFRAEDLSIGEPAGEIARPVYLPGYVAWEHRCRHHDQLTDIHSLGLLLASLACGLDFSAKENLQQFVSARGNLFELNPLIHPVVAGIILQMTELDRHRRIQTVHAVVERLRHYRDQSVDRQIDISRLKGFREKAPTERSKILLTHLRSRLFEISRRNRLIYFRPTLQTLNLTLASVPLLLDHRNIRADQLFLWHDGIASVLAAGKPIVLGEYVRFEDAPYASGVLDQIIATEKRDRNEFGFSQLRLVLCFLRWHNLKDTPAERINSPLLLLPVELVRKKGVRDAYVLKPVSTEAEVNPALRHHLRQLYGLNLPERLDLSETSLDRFHEVIAEQIRASEPGVTLVRQDRPQIEMIHEKARQRLDQFRRRQGAYGARRYQSLDYSYDRERFRPLGVQLFHDRVKPAASPFADVTGRPPAPRRPYITGDAEPRTSEREQQFYALRESGDSGNPYQWDFDLCSVTLGNFNYRKMSLVRDYAALLERERAGASFASIFSVLPKATEQRPVPTPPLAEQFPVVACDPTQSRAVVRARSGQSYIIQGPPGTGKSQTITNLIADYVARGKRVLFVCEKRAAIDVVFHRLARQGLDELCCLIHDSQADKREFIRNLKQTYETFLAEPVDPAIDTRRTEVIRGMEQELDALRRWSAALEARLEGCGSTVRGLVCRLVELHGEMPELSPVAVEQLPPYAEWEGHAGIVRALGETLRRLGRPPALALHPFRHLNERALRSPQPVTTVTQVLEESERLVETVDAALHAAPEVEVRTLADLEAVAGYAASVAPLAAADSLELLNGRAAKTRRVVKAVREWRAAGQAHTDAKARTSHWQDRLSADDARAALTQARRFEEASLAWLRPSWWRLRKLLHARYTFAAHAVAPSWPQILQQLVAEYDADAAEAKAGRMVQDELGELEVEAALPVLDGLAQQEATLSAAARRLHAYLVENPEATLTVQNLAALKDTADRLRATLELAVDEFQGLAIEGIRRELQLLRKEMAALPDILPDLIEILSLPEKLRQTVRRLPLAEKPLEAAIARKSLAAAFRHEPSLEATDGDRIARRTARLESLHDEWLAINARWIRQRVRQEFLRKVQITGTPASQLTPEQKELKRLYTAGRRELEHEFSKTMRHRSIRDLADDETGVVLRDVKPVWLMSPLSVSDTLPLAEDAFDVVIFDEASQILVEEAVPTVCRAPQAIVVGDEMQLPPTNFFSANRSDDDPLLENPEAESVLEDLDADSFLTQSARNLPSTMLGWHYRSRSEALISFSNQAFYQGELLTVPDRKFAATSRSELVVQQPTDAEALAGELLNRSVSFHRIRHGLYEQRRNAAEADYIAHLVRDLLRRETKLSIGIVAFSEAQQGEIEGALERLGATDAAFATALAAEFDREEAGEFCGLFVKNLENVQGDERDIILLSVCYARDRNGRMLMNFGPINQRGGEKRLNVIFSRAKRHMAVISTIRHAEITNDYNDGANCLRNFLEYAESCSIGNAANSSRVLAMVNAAGKPAAESRSTDPVAAQIATALRDRGMLVETHVGESRFRLPMAVRRAGGESHELALLVDDPDHFQQHDLLERYLLRPAVLRSFGWRTLLVHAKDWHQDRATVLRRVEQALDGNELAPSGADHPEVEAEPVTEEAPSPPPVQSGKPDVVQLPAGAPRTFECTEDGSSKFWEVCLSDAQLTVRFGRIGTKGQSQTRLFATPAAAQVECDKLIRSKLAKGYSEKTAHNA